MNDNQPQSWRSKVPSFVWLIIFAGGIVLAIAIIIGVFYALSNIAGVASLIFLVIGYFTMRNTGNSMANAAVIGFFALMGVAVDQPGNPIYNLPVGIWQCPDGTELNRGVDVTHPLPERTDITQNFSCVDDSGTVVKQIGLEYVALVRLIEYLLIGYLFMFINGVRKRLRGDNRDDELINQPLA